MRRIEPADTPVRRFDRPVILRQPALWSRAIVWGLVAASVTVLVWAAVARIEEAVPAQGKLEPDGAVKEIQAPVGGVVRAIHVHDGQRVRKGDLLVSLVPTVSKAQVDTLTRIRASLVRENRFYRTQMNEAPVETGPPELTALTLSRTALVAENRLYEAELGRDSDLDPGQRERFTAHQSERATRVAAAQLTVEQVEKQLAQNQAQIASSRDVLAINQQIFDDISPLFKEGGLSKVQYLRQQQEVRTGQGEVERLDHERERLNAAVAQTREQLANVLAADQKDLLTRTADNSKQIAEIDTRLAKVVVENDKRIAEIDAQLSQAQLTMQYQQLRAPTDGTVFDLRARTPGFVVNSSEPLLKIVPPDSLVAKIFITNRDIGFVREGMEAEVRIDSFPFMEFGDIRGRLVSIGSDALPPTEVRPFYSFPARVRLDRQSLRVRGREIPLQSGMSISTHLKVRDRTVLSIFTELFTRPFDSLRSVR